LNIQNGGFSVFVQKASKKTRLLFGWSPKGPLWAAPFLTKKVPFLTIFREIAKKALKGPFLGGTRHFAKNGVF